MLVERPGGLDLHVLVWLEEVLDPGILLLGEQVGPGQQGPAGFVERILFAAPVAVDLLLDSSTAPLASPR